MDRCAIELRLQNELLASHLRTIEPVREIHRLQLENPEYQNSTGKLQRDFAVLFTYHSWLHKDYATAQKK
ncbi:MAG: hypothetical protein Q9184_007930, partial [Pyrenodesmia sp. 2 TL-2023]